MLIGVVFSLWIVFIAVQPYFNFPYHILYYSEQYSGCQMKHFEIEKYQKMASAVIWILPPSTCYIM